MSEIAITIPDELLEAIVARVTANVLEALDHPPAHRVRLNAE